MNPGLKKPIQIALLILSFSAILSLRLCRTTSSVNAPHPHPAIEPEAEPASCLLPKHIPTQHLPELKPALPASQPLVEHLSPTLQPWLTERQGSYTNFNDFLQSGAPRFSVSSGWGSKRLFPDRKLPVMELNLTRDPLTRQYQLSGGTIKLPWSGLEAGYDRLPDTEEQKARIQWKKEF